MNLYLLQLGIFDDGDVEPTFCIMLTDVVNLAAFEQLLQVGEQQYGTRPPPHAQFWDCSLAPAGFEEFPSD